ncbi:MAG: pyrroline-5-carboxylate reductase [Legionella sp.]|nr:MAG: pyrroline-5-carboxylate reductase [Legionella sp.]
MFFGYPVDVFDKIIDNSCKSYFLCIIMKISIIGYGNMAAAICQGLLLDPEYYVHVASPSLIIGQLQPRLHTHSNNLAILPDADVLILAVKPAQMATVLEEIRAYIPHNLLIISVAAGLGFSWFQHYLPPNTALVRALPNLAAACRQSATPLIANSWVTHLQHQQATAVFEQCGKITWAQHEEELDTYTALSGSGVAYLLMFTDAMRKGAITLGLDEDTASSFAIQTLQGAASLAALPDQTLSHLQDKITSKAGTTAAALAVFAQHQLTDTVLAAMTAAVERSQTLRKE